MQKRVKDIINEIAKKYELPISVVTEMVQSPWHYSVKKIGEVNIDEINEEELPIFKMTHLGQFKFSNKKIIDAKNKKNGSS